MGIFDEVVEFLNHMFPEVELKQVVLDNVDFVDVEVLK